MTGCGGGVGRAQAPGRAVITAVALVLMAVTALAPSPAASQAGRSRPGTLDGSFGTGGVVLTDDAGSHDVARDVLVLPDGRIVTAGFWGRTDGERNTFDLGLARYLPDGSLDATFGGDGRVATEFLPGGYEEAVAVLPGPRGRVIAVGTAFSPSGTDPRFALARYLPDGSLDPAFGEGGKVTTSAGKLTFATAAAVQADGRIVVAGYGEDWSLRTSPYLVLARYRPDGALDPTFGDGGVLTTTLADDPRSMAQANDVAVARDGSIVAVGWVAAPETADWAVARFRADGSPDLGFGDAGLARVSLDDGSFEEASAVALLPGGGIALVGYSGGWTLASLRAVGTLDSRFGDGGTVRSISSGDPSDIVVDARGNLLVTNFGAALMRFRRDGQPDRRFGIDGVADLAITSGEAAAIAVQSDGAIVIAGSRYGGPPDSATWTDVMVARYHG